MKCYFRVSLYPTPPRLVFNYNSGQTDIFVEKHLASAGCKSRYASSDSLPSLTSSVSHLGDSMPHVAKGRLLIEGYLPVLSRNAQLFE